MTNYNPNQTYSDFIIYPLAVNNYTQSNLNIHLFFQNIGNKPIYIREFGIWIDYLPDEYFIRGSEARWAYPNQFIDLGIIDIPISQDVGGTRKFQSYVQFTVCNSRREAESDQSFWTSGDKVIITPEKGFKVFVSRSNRPSDRPIVDPIVESLKNWNFAPRTVGINVPGGDNFEQTIKNEIENSDAIIYIVTKRDLNINNQWSLSSWIHAESGIGMAHDKPSLVIYDQDISLDGALKNSPLAIPVDFQNFNMDDIDILLNSYIPIFRDWIEDFKNANTLASTNKTIGKIILGAGIYFLGKNSGQSECRRQY